MVWLGIDVGQKRSGVALSESGILTRPLMLLRGPLADQLVQLLDYIQRQPVDTIVLGQPPSVSAGHPAKEFAAMLTAALPTLPQPVRLAIADETLTSKEAERQATRHPADTDMLAAQLILEQYLSEEESHAE